MRPESADRLELVVDARAELGEGPLWSVRERCLWWVDIIGRRLHRSDPATGADRVLDLPGMPGAVVERARGGLALAWAQGFAALDPTSGAITPWTHPEAHLAGNRFNDGKVDPRGAFWAGTMSAGAEQGPVGSLYRLDAERRVTKHATGVCVSNGLAWSADGRTLFYIDTLTNRIDALALDDAGATVVSRRPVVEIDPKEHGWLDGMCIDAEGLLWVGHYGGGRVNRFDPRTGKIARTVRLPVSNATSCCFGGPKLDALYITTARLGLSPEQLAREPHAGGIYRLETGPIGLAAALYAG